MNGSAVDPYSHGLIKEFYSAPTGNDPILTFDSIDSPRPGVVAVAGWAFDPDNTAGTVNIHIYSGSKFLCATAANVSRPDVNAVHGCGDNHGFYAEFCTWGLSGDLQIGCAALNEFGGGNTVWAYKNVTVAPDTVPPTFHSVRVTNITTTSYTVTANVTDEAGVASVKLPTWSTAQSTDQAVWHEAKQAGTNWSCTMQRSAVESTYFTDPYAYDAAGNHSQSARITVKNLTVSFNANGGSCSQSSKLVAALVSGAGDKPTYGALPTPTRSGYTFAGWYTAAADGNQVTSSTQVANSNNHTLYAHWKANSFYLDLNGYYNGAESPNFNQWGTADVYVNGKLVADDVSDYYTQHPNGASYEIKDVKAKPGYTYEGVQSGALSGTITAAVTTVLKFAPAKYTVTYDSNGGPLGAVQVVTYGEPYGTLPTMEREGYRFDGWYTDPENGELVTKETIVTATENHTLYAHWTSLLEIVEQPVNFIGTVGKTAVFAITATGHDLTYQWQYSMDGGKTWQNSSSTSTTATCTLTSANRDGWIYRCIVTDGSGNSVTSETAMVIVNPSITAQPKDASGVVGQKLTFTVAAAGKGLTYQWEYSTDGGKTWQKSSSTSTTATCTLSSANRDGWLYRCIVKSSNGRTVTTDTAKVTVNLTITAQPKNASGTVGQKLTFTVGATGRGLTYQWQYSTNGGKTWNASSSKSASATCTLSSADRDGWLYRCIVKSSNGQSVTTGTARVTVKPAITTQPKDAVGTLGQKVTFTIAATGKGLTYRWQYSTDGGKTWKASTSTSTTATCTLSGAERDGWLYRCIVTDANGSTVTSCTAKVLIKTPLKITVQPKNYYGSIGGTARFTVKAEGTGLTYQWQYSANNGESWNLSSSKSATATCTIQNGRDGWIYRCIITDAFGEKITSNYARLIIE